MTTGFGFCPNCGAAMTEAGQRFCAACGFTLPVSAAAAAGVAPASAMVPPHPAGPQPPAPPWAMAPVAPVGATPPRTAVSPALILVGVLVIVAIGAAGVFAMNGSKASPSGSAGHSGGLFGSALPTGETEATPTPVAATPTPVIGGGLVTLKPSSFSCSDTSTQVTMSVWLPASVSASEEVKGELDGVAVSTRVVGDNFKKQSDGRWLRSETDSAAAVCSGLEAGKHVYRVLDSQDKVLAQGSFTTTAAATPAPTPTPGIGGGIITIEPSSISCSAATGDVTISIWLPGSVSASEQITAHTDGSNESTEAVRVEFTKQSDGRWFLGDNLSVSSMCSSLDTGKHTLSVTDSHDALLATGSFTLRP
jgi:hypothetical protein